VTKRTTSRGSSNVGGADTTTTPSSTETPNKDKMIEDTKLYYRVLWYFHSTGGDFSNCPFLQDPEELPIKIHLYGLYLDLYLWGKPHYRAPTYRHDIRAVSVL